jgi:hypothetical protein
MSIIINFENSTINPLYENIYTTDNSDIISTSESESYSEYDSEYDSDSQCRICLENGEEEELINICQCKGSVKYVHKTCISSWVNSFPPNHDKHLKCQLCRTNFNLDMLDIQSSVIQSPNVVETRNFAIYFIGFLYFFALVLTMLMLLLSTN